MLRVQMLLVLVILGQLVAPKSKQPESWSPLEMNFWSLAWTKLFLVHAKLQKTETLLSD